MRVMLMNEDHGAGAEVVLSPGGWRAGLLGLLLAGLLMPATVVGAEDEVAKPKAYADAGAEIASTVLDDLADRQEALFRAIITDTGLVRYDVLAKPENRKELQALVAEYAELAIPEVKKVVGAQGGETATTRHEERLVFLMNAYNLNVLEQVLATGIPQRVLDVDGFFDQREITVGGMVLTLNSLENTYVRPLGDPRIHAALNCAALSCPALARKAFRVETLDADLDELCRRWVNDGARNLVDDSGQVMVSQIFDWFASDFEVPAFGDRVGFLMYYVDPENALASALPNLSSDSGTAGLGFLEYDWQLNASPRDSKGAATDQEAEDNQTGDH